MIRVLFFSLLILIFLPQDVSAQVVINELSTNTSSDWVELYAFEDTDISGWILDDYNTSSNLEEFPAGTAIGPSTDAFLSVEVGNRLNNPGDIVTLFNASSEKIDEMVYGDKGGVCLPSDNGSVGRVDNGNTVERFAVSTKEASNTGAQLDSCPTPTPSPTNSPTPTPKPTSTPKPTKTPTPTPTNTPTPKPTIKVTKTPTKKQTLTNKDEEKESFTLGLRDELSTTPTPGDNTESTTSGNFPIFAGLFILGGIGFIGAAAYPFFKKKRYNPISDSEQKDS